MLNHNLVVNKIDINLNQPLNDKVYRPKSSAIAFRNVSFGDTFSVVEDCIKFDIKQLEQEAKKLGVKASYGSNVYLGKLVNEALKEVKEAGYKLPKKIVYGGDGHRSDKAAYVCGAVIYLKPGYDWKGLAENTKINHKYGITSSDNPKHLIYHEIAHAIHPRSSPIKYYLQRGCPTPMNQYDRGLISSEVSSYATDNVFDFVAEVFAGKMDGKAYSEEINDIYNELGGPIPKKL